jgi:hypothetical protein
LIWPWANVVVVVSQVAVTEVVVLQAAVTEVVAVFLVVTEVVDLQAVAPVAVALPAVATVVVDRLPAAGRATSFVASTPTATGCLTQTNRRVVPGCSWIASLARYLVLI